jgi:hypothetical protein
VVFLFTIITRESLETGGQAIVQSLNEAAEFAREAEDEGLPPPEEPAPPEDG